MNVLEARGIGRVESTLGELVRIRLPLAQIGSGVCIYTSRGATVQATVIGIDPRYVTVMPHGTLEGVSVGDRVETDPSVESMPLGINLLGRIIDAGGRPLDGKGPINGRMMTIIEPPIPPSTRAPITKPFWTGIKAMDGLLTVGQGARMGVFGAPSAGKSTLLSMLVNGAEADAIVVALIGERGREAAEWMEKITPRTTIVVTPSDCSAAERARAAHVAMAQASQLRRRGLNVLLILDSLMRFAAALREIAVAAGESVGRGGFPPSVFAELARLVERAGNAGTGSVTMFATVLSDGGNENDPLSEAAKSLLDGHIVMSETLARAGHYPAIEILRSVSRTMNEVVTKDHRKSADSVREAMSSLERTREMRELGFAPQNVQVERAVENEENIKMFLRQSPTPNNPRNTVDQLLQLGAHLL
jgi:type III secretion protein N (ATPase)